MLKICNRCGVSKNLNDFFKDKANKADGHYGMCKSCKNEATAKWRSENRSVYNSGMRAYNQKHRRRIHYKRAYGITPDEFNARLDAQGGCCWICKKTAGKKKRPLAMDHDHKTGKLRGIICYHCNRGLHYFDDQCFYKKALEYLQYFSAE